MALKYMQILPFNKHKQDLFFTTKVFHCGKARANLSP